MIHALMKSKIGLPIIIFAVAIILIALFMPRNGNPFAVYRAGWEINADLLAFKVNGLDPSKTDYNQDGKIDVKDAYLAQKNPNLIKCEPNVNLQIDPDAPTWGIPDVKATVSDIREEVPKQPFTQLQQDVNSYKYVIDYHEYLFDVQVRTIASVVLNNNNPERSHTGLTTNYWEHETAEPHSWATIEGSGGNCIGKEFDGGVYARFACIPWGILDFGPVPENYTFDGYWLGVMDAKIDKSNKGNVQGAPEQVTHQGWVRNVQSDGAPLNMYEDDGTFAKSLASVPWDATKILSPDIKGTIVMFLPFSMMAGAFTYYDVNAYTYNGAITQLKPVDEYLTYTVRMECLVVKQYSYSREPITPVNPSPIQPPSDYVPYQPLDWWGTYGMWIIIVAIIAVIVIIAVAWISGIGALALLSGGLFRMVDRKKMVIGR